ncbi:hypothetical protein HXX01_04350 [Candidatus Nomurabacteria bacterium]|nr:hypothetical protein [Candidatus Nomurabacteria bacterium]
MPEEVLVLEQLVKTARKHPTDEELLDQIIEVIKETKTLPKGEHWDHLSVVKRKKYAGRNTFFRHFGSFEGAVKRALERIEEKDLKIYYLKRCN